MEVNVVVLHTTEGRSLPSYDGGALAPNLTAVPDFNHRRLDWFQHFDIDISSRALRNLAGGVETNTLNVCQVELVGTCDPATHRKWEEANYAHIYWPEAPDWALRDLAAFLRWMHEQHDVPLSGPASWPAYPSSYGTASGQRMSNAQWNDFEGVCGHMHVPENDHGDPGEIDFVRLIALARGDSTPAPSEEDDMPISEYDADLIARRVLTLDGVIKNPTGATDNPYIALATAVGNLDIIARRSEAKIAAQGAAITELTRTVAALAANSAALDPDALVARITGEIEKVTIRLDVPDAP
jgi:hypothetical protein